ncbi:MAG: hypothetical protein E7273_11240 [Pseudobutyrivibrio ruminis]|nr:hypothetical protein [Pseudobutyrivibrio ruminis]
MFVQIIAIAYVTSMRRIIMKTNGALGKLGKISYAIYFAGQLCFYCLVGVFVSTYMTDIGIPLAAVGLILVIARVWDAINDPIFGIIVDKTKWKSGNKYLPWIKISTGLITATSIALFLCPSGLPTGMKTAWVGIAYICWGMSYTMCDIPIYALPTGMTDDVKERSVIISFGRIACTIAGGFITLLFPILRSNLGWTATGLLFSIIGGLLMIPAALNIRENSKTASTNNLHLSEMLTGVLKNKYLLIYYSAYMLSGCLNFATVTSLYFARYCLGSEAKASLVSLCTMIPSFVIMVIVPMAIKKFDKFRIYHTCLIIATVLGFARYFAGYENEALFYTLLVTQGIFSSVTAMLTFMFTPDFVEYGVFKNGATGSGIMFSIQTFTSKLVSAISGALGVALLGFFGFQTGENAIQTATAVNGIWVCTALAPTIGTALAAIILFTYKLRDKNVQIMAEANNGKITREEAINQLAKMGWKESLDSMEEDFIVARNEEMLKEAK